MVKNHALRIITLVGMIFLTYVVISIQIPGVYARGPSSLFGRANGLLPLPNILSSSRSSDKGSEITPNVSDNSNNISPNAGGGNNKLAVTTPKIADQSVTASKIAGLNKLLFATCNTSYTDQSPAVDVSCSLPGVEVGDRIIVTAQKFTDETSNTPFGCGVVSSAIVSQPDTVRIGIGNICAPQHTITVTFAMITYHEK